MVDSQFALKSGKEKLVSEKLLEVRNLTTHFFLREGNVRAVNNIDLDIFKGKTLGVVGESGCGKSVTAQSIMRILPEPPGKILNGEILFDSDETEETIDLAKLPTHGRKLKSLRGKEIAMIFQEPMSSFSPVHTIGDQIMEVVLIHEQDVSKQEAREIAVDRLKRVGISRPQERVEEYPHQLSGGMRQRAMIAMALACQPKLLIADEPTTALDVTIQAQILELLRNLQDDYNMAIMFITHDLGVIAEMAHDVLVMYLGHVLEYTDVDSLFFDAQHPYTKSLMKSIPRADRKSEGFLPTIKGSVPDPYSIPEGCPFVPRCEEISDERCQTGGVPSLAEVKEDHRVRCFLNS